jgi:hypothetical protein
VLHHRAVVSGQPPTSTRAPVSPRVVCFAPGKTWTPTSGAHWQSPMLTSPLYSADWRAPSVTACPRVRAYACPPSLTSGPSLSMAPPVRSPSLSPSRYPSHRLMGPARQSMPMLPSHTKDAQAADAWDPSVSPRVRSRAPTSNLGRPFPIG